MEMQSRVEHAQRQSMDLILFKDLSVLPAREFRREGNWYRHADRAEQDRQVTETRED